MKSGNERAQLIVLSFLLITSLIACTPNINSENTVTEGVKVPATTATAAVLTPSDSVSLAGILLAAKVVLEIPAEEVGGVVEVVEGCVAIIDATSKVARLAVWPSGSVFSPTGAIRLTNGSLEIGQSVDPSKGWVVDSANFFNLRIYDSADSFDQDAKRCLPLFDEVLVLSYVRGFGQAE